MLPMKTGMLRYAYERELLVQPLVSFGIENAMSEYTFRIDWEQKPLIEYHVSDWIDPKDYKPDSDSNIRKSDRTLEAFIKKVEKTLYTEFERNHAKVDPSNNREHFLREGEEREIYENAPVGQKSYSLNQYSKDKRKKKRH